MQRSGSLGISAKQDCDRSCVVLTPERKLDSTILWVAVAIQLALCISKNSLCHCTALINRLECLLTMYVLGPNMWCMIAFRSEVPSVSPQWKQFLGPNFPKPEKSFLNRSEIPGAGQHDYQHPSWIAQPCSCAHVSSRSPWPQTQSVNMPVYKTQAHAARIYVLLHTSIA